MRQRLNETCFNSKCGKSNSRWQCLTISAFFLDGRTHHACVLSCFSSVWRCVDPMDCSLPGSSLHGILLARILGWVAISFSRGYSPQSKSNWTENVSQITSHLVKKKKKNNKKNNTKFHSYFSFQKRRPSFISLKMQNQNLKIKYTFFFLLGAFVRFNLEVFFELCYTKTSR